METIENEDLIEQEEAMLKEIGKEISRFGRERKNLIPILQMVQERHAYLDSRVIDMVADCLNIAACEVYGVATFYNQFRFHPPGKHHIKVCLGTACHVRGGGIILENFERKLEIKDGETTSDREFSLERVACVGCCALAPVAVVGEDVHGKVAPSKVEGLILGFQIEKQKKQREEGKTDG